MGSRPPSSRMSRQGDSRALGFARAGRDHNAAIAAVRDLCHRDLVVAAHDRLGSELAQKLHQVIGE